MLSFSTRNPAALIAGFAMAVAAVPRPVAAAPPPQDSKEAGAEKKAAARSERAKEEPDPKAKTAEGAKPGAKKAEGEKAEKAEAEEPAANEAEGGEPEKVEGGEPEKAEEPEAEKAEGEEHGTEPKKPEIKANAGPPPPGPTTEQRAKALRVRPRSSQRGDNSDRLLIGGGAALVSLGALAAVPMIIGLKGRSDARQALAGLDLPSEADQRSNVHAFERRMTGLAIGTGIAAAVYLVSGLTLIGLGTTGRRRANRLTVAPTAGRGSAGLVVGGRF